MRLPLVAPADLNPEQRPLYENTRVGIERDFAGFETIAENGASMGPWNPWLHEPKFGKPIWDLRWHSQCLHRCRTPLVTGTVFHSAYEHYAHVIAAERNGLPNEKLATVLAGQRPADLTSDEGVAYDVASALPRHGTLRDELPTSGQAI
jgi:hypothetical protein